MQSSPVARRPALMLASVASVAEARLAASGGADLVDCKDPRAGALGALDVTTVAAVRRTLPPSLPVSATIGDEPFGSDVCLELITAMAATGIDYVKIGLYPGDDFGRALSRLAGLRLARARLVAVMLAEHGIDLGRVAALADAGFAGVMLDTADKAGRSLPDIVPPDGLAAFITAVRGRAMFCGLAGALRLAHVPALVALGPDVIGFRGALCAGAARTASLDPAAVAAIRHAIPSNAAPRALPQRATA